MLKESESTFLQRPKNGHLYEKVLNISNQQGNIYIKTTINIRSYLLGKLLSKDNRQVSLGAQRKRKPVH